MMKQEAMADDLAPQTWPTWRSEAAGGFPSQHIHPGDLEAELTRLAQEDAELLTAIADETTKTWRIFFALPLPRAPRCGVMSLSLSADAGRLPSGSRVYPMLAWYERLAQEQLGWHFSGLPKLDAALVHDAPPAPLAVHDGILRLPLGPVREAVVESGHFLIETVGEEIVHLNLRLLYKHRGMAALARGRSPEQAILVAERVAGLSSVAHALAAAQAMERALGIAVPERARWLRMALAEAERIYNHIGDTAWVCRAAGLAVGDAELAVLKEDCLRANAALCGSRYLRGLVAVGGLNRDVAPDRLAAWNAA